MISRSTEFEDGEDPFSDLAVSRGGGDGDEIGAASLSSLPSRSEGGGNFALRRAFRDRLDASLREYLSLLNFRGAKVIACRIEELESKFKVHLIHEPDADTKRLTRLIGKVLGIPWVAGIEVLRTDAPDFSSRNRALRTIKVFDVEVPVHQGRALDARAFSPRPGGSSHDPVKRTGLTVPELERALRKLLPLTVEPHKISFYHATYARGAGASNRFPFFVLKAFVPPDQFEDFARARDEFETRYQITVFPQIVPDSPGVRQELEALFPGAELLTDASRDKIRKELLRPREVKSAKRNYSPEDFAAVRDLTSLHTITIDGPETSSKEDAFGISSLDHDIVVDGVRRRSRSILLTGAFVSAVPYAPAGSPAEQAARERVFPLFGKDVSKLLLSRDVTRRYASFRERRDRIAFCVSCLLPEEGPPQFFVINDQGECEFVSDPQPYMGLMRVDEELTPEMFASRVSNDQSGLDPCSLIVEADRRLKRAGEVRGDIRRLDGASVGDIVVSDMMIFFKKAFFEFMNARNIPALYRNQTFPSWDQAQQVVDECARHGVEITVEAFTDPSKLFELCNSLKESDDLPLLSRIFEVFFEGARVGFDSKGHHSVGAEHYGEIKPHKGYYGFFNQLSLAAYLQGTPSPLNPSDTAGMQELEDQVNAKLDSRDALAYRFRLLATIYHQLANVGKEFTARVERVRDDEVLFDVPGFSKWGALSSADFAEEVHREVAASLGEFDPVSEVEWTPEIRVRLEGFNPKKMRFVFTPILEEVPDGSPPEGTPEEVSPTSFEH